MVKRRAFPPRSPWLVAAIDGNHGGRLSQARRLIALAADAGADAVKFAAAADRAGAEAPPFAPPAWRALRREARARGIAFVLAPRDVRALAMTLALAPDAYQIDPPSLGDRTLVARIERQRRPVLVAGGACTMATLRAAVTALRRCPIVVLHAVASPGLPPAKARLRYLTTLASRLRAPMGYLGYETGPGWSLVAASMGAVVIEKAFTIDRHLAGAGHAASLDPAELASLATSLRDLEQALAPVGERRVFAEELAHLDRSGRNLVARRPLARGATLKAGDVESRPGTAGLSPRLGDWLTGRRLRYDVEAGEPLTFGMVDAE
jgi:sialic acid synthase SpsE